MQTTVTKHGKQRLKERAGIKGCSADRIAERAFEQGIKREEATGDLYKYLTWLHCYHDEYRDLRVHNYKVFIFSDTGSFVTVETLPSKYKIAFEKARKAKQERDITPDKGAQAMQNEKITDMNEVKVYTHPDFGSLEIWIGPDGKPWFPATESAEILKYANPREAILDHCIEAGVAFRDISYPSGTKKKKYINRPNLSRLIARSHLPEAVRFESWIFDDVIESVFDYGGYLSPQKVEEVLLNPDTIIRLATDLKIEREKALRLQTANTELSSQVEHLRPMAAYADIILRNPGLVTITQIAKDYGMTGTAMNRLLHKLSVQYKQSG